ncbi:Blue light- and temperature-regulated antirepressor YcgF [Sulfitobacter sp. THAF37]|uniref:BLUF domain-containing protein n=1 Tax=Sulfitobacter sp. THAF37 TaxID=2587855 RepID=UPI0012698671|nr:BLUF domain-containing protein [Sulfitobacter sp. THAF37]QFT58419.1 Blue light- and temperature-regulated antirepressor YcgF [Sulfitobacter sp. THAF37]
MIRLLYFSTAKPNLEPAEIDSIVAISQTNNENRDITGALTYNGRNFCQLLEGDEIAVRDLVEVIRNDNRHSGFKIIDEKRIEARAFDGWSMKRVENLDFSSVINAMSA